MAYDRQALRFTWLYDIQGTEEIANTSYHTSGAAGWTGAEEALDDLSDAQMSDLYDAWILQYDVTNYVWANYSRLGALKVAAIDENGLYLTEPRIFEPVTAATGDGANVLPQSTIVASLRSNSTIGPANYGRMYLPHSRIGLDTTTPFAEGSPCATLASFLATYIETSNAVTNGLSSPSLAQILSSKGAGAAKGVQRVGIGNVTDTQRRRRNRLQETYFFEPVTF